MRIGSPGLTLAIGLVPGVATARADEGGERARKGTADRDSSTVASTWFDKLYDVIKSPAASARRRGLPYSPPTPGPTSARPRSRSTTRGSA